MYESPKLQTKKIQGHETVSPYDSPKNLIKDFDVSIPDD